MQIIGNAKSAAEYSGEISPNLIVLKQDCGEPLNVNNVAEEHSVEISSNLDILKQVCDQPLTDNDGSELPHVIASDESLEDILQFLNSIQPTEKTATISTQTEISAESKSTQVWNIEKCEKSIDIQTPSKTVITCCDIFQPSTSAESQCLCSDEKLTKTVDDIYAILEVPLDNHKDIISAYNKTENKESFLEGFSMLLKSKCGETKVKSILKQARSKIIKAKIKKRLQKAYRTVPKKE